MRQEDVERLREWSLMQPHHPKDVDEEIYSAYVHGSKSIEIAKKKLESLFTWRAYLDKAMPFYNIRDPTDPYFLQCAKVGKLFFLPNTTPEGCKILFTCMTDLFDEYFDHDQTSAYFILTAELAMKLWPDIKGIYILWDLKGVTSKRVAKTNLTALQISTRYFQDCFAFKMKRLVLFNSPTIVEPIYNTLIKPFLKEKMRERVKFTAEDSSCLKQYLPQELLPMDYGGEAKHSTELHDDWYALLVEHKDWLKNVGLIVADESKRPPDSIKPSFGVEGTFRSLAID